MIKNKVIKNIANAILIFLLNLKANYTLKIYQKIVKYKKIFEVKMDYKKELINLISSQKLPLNEDLDADSGVKFYMQNTTSEFCSTLYQPSFCVVLQGAKTLFFNKKYLHYDSDSYLISTTYIPAKIKIEQPAPNTPYMGFVVKFTLEQIYEIIKEIDDDRIYNRKNVKDGFCISPLKDDMLEPIYRLAKSIASGTYSKFIENLIIKEIIYMLLQTNGDLLKEYVLEGNLANQVIKVIEHIKLNCFENINIKELSRKIGISESSLYQNFKKITSLSPIQYQKMLRLEEAKSMLTYTNEGIGDIAFKVGYESPSQFSREYARMFGVQPKIHANILKQE